MDISAFVNMTSRAWTIPILAHLHAGVAGRQAPLLAATGASRTAFAQSMDHLIEIGLLERNPGHGHPLRPEFRLTALGITAVPVLTALHTPRRFNDIKRDLPSITDRALSQSLKTMEVKSWVSRHVDETSRPPKPVYAAVNTGGLISQATAAEVRFG